MTESEAELKRKLLRWKNRIKAKCLKLNFGKTKVMTEGKSLDTFEEFDSHSFGVCGKGLGDNPISSIRLFGVYMNNSNKKW